MNEPCPCNKYPERFIACSDHCPKDERGDYGYKAWKAKMHLQKEAARLQRSIDMVAFGKSRKNWYNR